MSRDAHNGAGAASDEPGFGEDSIGSMLRLAADDELSRAQREQLAAALPADEAAARVAFERQLRSACARVMVADEREFPAVSAGLRESVERIVKRSAAVAAPAVDEPRRHAPRTSPRVQRTGRRVPRLAWVSLAACLLIVAGFVVIRLVTPAPTFIESPERGRVALVGFLGSEHRRCALDDDALKSKMTVYQLAAASTKFTKLLGGELSAEAIEKAGYEFLGSGRCAVPGGGSSIHMIFHDPNPVAASSTAGTPARHPSRFSLFIQHDLNELPIVDGVTYRLETGADKPLIVVWRHQGLLYYLVTETETQQHAVMESMHVPLATQLL